MLWGIIYHPIRKLRTKKGLTQEDMTRFGFNYRHYQKLESGAHSFSLYRACSELKRCFIAEQARIARVFLAILAKNTRGNLVPSGGDRRYAWF